MLPLKFQSPGIARPIGLFSVLVLLAAQPAWGVPDNEADLSVTVTVSDDDIEIQDEVTFTMRALNHDAHDTARNFSVTGNLPDNFRFISSSPGCQGETVVTCTLNDLSAGGGRSFDVVARAVSAGDVEFAASTSADELDGDLSNNDHSVSVEVSEPSLAENLTCKITLKIGLQLAACVPLGTVSATGKTYFPGTGQRFAPGLALTINVNGSNGLKDAGEVTSYWNEWADPYYEDWLDPAEKTQMYVYAKNFAFSHFFHDHAQAPDDLDDLKDPNYSNYDWSLAEAFLQSAPVRDGKAKVLLRFYWEKGYSPLFVRNYGSVTGHDGVQLDFAERNVVVALKNLLTAFEKRYNDNENMAGVIFDEVSYRDASSDYQDGKAEVMLHAADTLDKMMVYVYQNSGRPWDLVKHNPRIHPGYADARFFRDCGSSNQSIYDGVYDCEDDDHDFYRRAQISNVSDPNATPTGQRKAHMASPERNGYVIFTNDNTSNPFGRNLNRTTSGFEEMLNLYFWYHSGQPRAFGSARDSGLGDGRPDRPGVIPTHIVVLPKKDSEPIYKDRMDYNYYLTPEALDEVLTRFGAKGTKSIPALPHNWLQDG